MIFDTSSLFALSGGDPMMEPILLKANSLVIPAIVIGEFRYGISQSRDRLKYDSWFAEVLQSAQILAVDEVTAGTYARLRGELKKAGHPLPKNDLWVAALAIQHSLPVASQDERLDKVPGLVRFGW